MEKTLLILADIIRDTENNIYNAQVALARLKDERTRLLAQVQTESIRLPRVFNVGFLNYEANVEIPNQLSLSEFKNLLDGIVEELRSSGYTQMMFIEKKLDDAFTEAQEGDIIDIKSNSAFGYFYVYRDPETGELQVKRNQGNRGQFLPREALKTLHRHNLETHAEIQKVYGRYIEGVNPSLF
jgi:hypothetical protein